MANTCRVAVDLLGAEAKARDLMKGALAAQQRYPDSELTFICNPEELAPEQRDEQQIIDCREWVREGESLMRLLRDHSQPSIKVGLQMLGAGEVDGFVSLGYTGALMALSRRLLTMLKDIERPAIIKEFKGKRSPFFMLDVGANLATKPSTLVQFAHLGNAFAEGVGRVDRPRVALLNIGVEVGRGPAVLRKAAAEITEFKALNFCGFVEPNKLFDDIADVVVTDGFAGNLALKSIEGTAGFTRYLIRSEISKHGPQMSEEITQVFDNLSDSLNSQSHNGASLVGLNGVVVKGHNGTNTFGMTAAVEQAILAIKANVPLRVRHHLSMREGVN